ncbi:hypothetical protein CTAYLR_008699 [Chrysophaeum taylorii]|uniref:Protein kinase domain-containing protein n=1 Tax=Chrysophaeum taylorii TaxID=2483200 RepID=A0AAD7UKP4_9STRA|nr:hypothetical protein CTAYLR_008699 [Chrysophaeum taylorii]
MGLFGKFFRRDPCKDNYVLGRVLGQGSFAVVKRAVCKKDNTQWAVKIIKKSALQSEDKDSLDKEVKIMERLAALKHENIVLLREVFDAPDHFYMVMELCLGGEVFDRVVEKEKYTEQEARVAVKQVAEALRVCHSMGIVHRDLKPENLLYVKPTSDQIKLADFGLANILTPQTALETACGTPGYVAPEVLWGSGYTEEVDMWSLGVITYILMCGFPPFYDENQNRLFKKIRHGDYSFPAPYWDQVSDKAKKLVMSLLTVDPEERATADTVLKDDWITETTEDAPALVGFQENLARYNAKRKFKAGIMKMQAINLLKGASSRRGELETSNSDSG